jgi:hypothetical protein
VLVFALCCRKKIVLPRALFFHPFSLKKVGDEISRPLKKDQENDFPNRAPKGWQENRTERQATQALKGRENYNALSEIAEKVGFDDFYLQNTAVEKFHPHYFVGESLDFGLFQQSPLGQTRKIFFLNSI